MKRNLQKYRIGFSTIAAVGLWNCGEFEVFQMENRTMGGVGIELYREYMKSNLEGLRLKQGSQSIDDIASDILEDKESCSSVDSSEYKEFITA